MLDKGKQLLGYLTVEARGNYFRGAALVTDFRGIPTDFRYTEPVQPTKLERILYGGALDVYLREEVILDNLLDAVETRPVLWLVNAADLMLPVQKLSRLPAMLVESSNRSPLDASGLFEPTTEQCVFIFQADNISAPLRMTVPDDSIQGVAQFVQTLSSAAEGMDLLEPFGRIDKALEAIGDSETKQK
ncbi:MAG: hypothetical protein LBI74_08450 [Synergistaceae bacterium]|nr:hypothetical protein [Synergistaceae bacterium]